LVALVDIMRKFLLLIILFIGFNFCFSQNFSRPGEWKKFRKEVFVTMGTANFLGDLGGRDRIGTDYSPVDLNFSQTRTAFGAGFRYKLDRWINVTGTFNYLILRGNDAKTNEEFRNNRNLNFKSNIFELAGRVEIGFQSTRVGNRYGIKRTLTNRMTNKNHAVFAFIGVGGFYYNPKGQYKGSGAWIKLRGLHTEGQGLPGGPRQYTNYSICIPIGGFYKLTFNRTWSIGLEFAWRKTFTDYIDDVSSRYYDPIALGNAYGAQSVLMADPSLGLIDGFSSPDASGLAAQRGDVNQKDSYMSLQITAGYVIKQKRKRARLRSKF
jgi:hypothetical protein